PSLLGGLNQFEACKLRGSQHGRQSCRGLYRFRLFVVDTRDNEVGLLELGIHPDVRSMGRISALGWLGGRPLGRGHVFDKAGRGHREPPRLGVGSTNQPGAWGRPYPLVSHWHIKSLYSGIHPEFIRGELGGNTPTSLVGLWVKPNKGT